MPVHIDPNDPKCRSAAAEILRRHDNGEPEANITSVVRDFLIVTGLARSEEMVEENPPSDASRRAVDLLPWIPSSSSSGASERRPVAHPTRSTSSNWTTI